jgi:hypothetical protein
MILMIDNNAGRAGALASGPGQGPVAGSSR